MKIAREIEWTKMENTWLRAFEITKYLKENIENVEKLEKMANLKSRVHKILLAMSLQTD